MQYTKPWLSLEQHVDQLSSREIEVGGRDQAVELLKSVGYYRLTGYLYPFRKSVPYLDNDGHTHTRVLSDYRPGTTLSHAAALIDFDRQLSLLVMEGAQRSGV